MSQVVAPLLSKIIARFLLNAENSGWRLGLGFISIEEFILVFTLLPHRHRQGVIEITQYF